MSEDCRLSFFFFNDPPPTEIYPLSLHDALPIPEPLLRELLQARRKILPQDLPGIANTLSPLGDRKSTRLNSSHANISYAVFCLKKKTQHVRHRRLPGGR